MASPYPVGLPAREHTPPDLGSRRPLAPPEQEPADSILWSLPPTEESFWPYGDIRGKIGAVVEEE